MSNSFSISGVVEAKNEFLGAADLSFAQLVNEDPEQSSTGQRRANPSSDNALTNGGRKVSTAEAHTLESVLFDNRVRLKQLTSQLSMHLNDGQRRKLFSELDRLLDHGVWIEDEDSLVRDTSYRSFLRFITYYKKVKDPSLGVSDEGNIIAAWFNDSTRLTLEFRPRDRVLAVAYRSSGSGGDPEVLTYEGRTEGIIINLPGADLRSSWLDG
jgi:hypothetical protein